MGSDIVPGRFLPNVPDDSVHWQVLRDEISPWIGERAVALFSYAISDENNCRVNAQYFEALLVSAGDDPDHPQVTETEQLLIDWGRLTVRSPHDIPPQFYAALEHAFVPELREKFLLFAAQIVAMNLVNTVGRVPA